MNCNPSCPPHAASRARAGFTLVEVLAAMLFMAIVIPVAVHGVRIAAQAGSVAAHKVTAARIAEQVLNEMVITGQTQKSGHAGSVTEAGREYKWTMSVESSGLDTLRLVMVQVVYPVQGQEYDVRLATLVNTP